MTITRLLAAALALLLAAGCATSTRTETRRVYAETSLEAVAAGDDVRVATRDGRKLDFRVTRVDDKTIQGKGVNVARADIASIRILETRTVRTEETSAAPAAQMVGTAVLAWMVVAIAAIAAVF